MRRTENFKSLRVRPALFMMGQNARGHWVVQELSGMRGGLFIDRVSALRYVRLEGRGSRQVVVMVNGVFELVIGKTTIPAAARQRETAQLPARQVA
jgi:hypothetical protein